MINSTPHQEEELLKIEVCFAKTLDVLMDMETISSDLKRFIIEYFNNMFIYLQIS